MGVEDSIVEVNGDNELSLLVVFVFQPKVEPIIVSIRVAYNFQNFPSHSLFWMV